MFLASLWLFNIFNVCFAIDGVIWDKWNQKFVPLFNIKNFLLAKNEHARSIRSLEYHNFGKQVLMVSYYQETNLVSFINNDTQISGVCGDIWTTLADYLNFTLVPIKLENKNFGNKFENGSYDGLLGLIQRDQSQIIPRSGVFASRLNLVEYTVPLWSIRYYLYVKPDWKHDKMWMFHLFSITLWISFFILLLLLSLTGYIYEKISMKTNKKYVRSNLQDHIIYTLAIASSQGSVPAEIHNKFRIIYICTSMFSWLILIAFSSHAIYLMMNRKYVLPFAGLRDLIRKSKYDVVAFNGSMVHQDFENTISRYFQYTRDLRRISYAPGAKELYERVCFSRKRKYAAFEAVDRHKAIGKHVCPHLVPSWESYFETWIASAIRKGFPYKRSFDVSIIKMIEFGLIHKLKTQWLEWKSDDRQKVSFQSIDMNQVYLIFAIWLLGLTAAILFLFFENFWMLVTGRLYRIQVKHKKSKVNINTNVLKSEVKSIFFIKHDYTNKN